MLIVSYPLTPYTNHHYYTHQPHHTGDMAAAHALSRGLHAIQPAT